MEKEEGRAGKSGVEDMKLPPHHKKVGDSAIRKSGREKGGYARDTRPERGESGAETVLFTDRDCSRCFVLITTRSMTFPAKNKR